MISMFNHKLEQVILKIKTDVALQGYLAGILIIDDEDYVAWSGETVIYSQNNPTSIGAALGALAKNKKQLIQEMKQYTSNIEIDRSQTVEVDDISLRPPTKSEVDKFMHGLEDYYMSEQTAKDLFA